MRVTDEKYFKAWKRAAGRESISALWKKFVKFVKSKPQATFNYYTESAAVYSSRIEGNSLDLSRFINSQSHKRKFKAKEFAEIENLIAAYTFAKRRKINETHLLEAHGILSQNLLGKSEQGVYRKSGMAVLGGNRIEYFAPEHTKVKMLMTELFTDIAALCNTKLEPERAFYHAALVHLIFVHIHPFGDGNGRSARLLEKWFLSQHLGTASWKLPSEAYIWTHREAYYQNLRVLGDEFYELNYDLCIPFLQMLPAAMKPFTVFN